MLVDIKRSTASAERLGDRQAHAFIASAFFDIDQPILEHRGEVYNYIGDELIASWPLSKGVDDARCVRCVLAIQDALARRADEYRRAFDSAPAVRISLHAGPVVAGECGDAKLAIVYLGDTYVAPHDPLHLPPPGITRPRCPVRQHSAPAQP